MNDDTRFLDIVVGETSSGKTTLIKRLGSLRVEITPSGATCTQAWVANAMRLGVAVAVEAEHLDHVPAWVYRLARLNGYQVTLLACRRHDFAQPPTRGERTVVS